MGLWARLFGRKKTNKRNDYPGGINYQPLAPAGRSTSQGISTRSGSFRESHSFSYADRSPEITTGITDGLVTLAVLEAVQEASQAAADTSYGLESISTPEPTPSAPEPCSIDTYSAPDISYSAPDVSCQPDTTSYSSPSFD